MSKRVLSFAMAMVLVISLAPATEVHVFAQASDISVTIDGRFVSFSDQRPVIVHGRTLVPVRDVFEMLGATVTWVEDSGEVTMTGLNGEITFEAGASEFMVDDESFSLAASSVVMDGTLYVPLMFFRDIYGAGSVTVQSGEVHINTHAPDDDMS